jgi:hypothetical protein
MIDFLDHHFRSNAINNYDELAQVVLFLGVVCSVIMGVSRRAGDFIMNTLSLIVRAAFQKEGGTIHPGDEAKLRQIPHNIRTAVDKFNLEGQTTTYAVCPACHCTYRPTFPHGSTTPHYPEHCSNIPNPDLGICNTLLLYSHVVNGVKVEHPIKKFVYHEFKDYLAGLLAQKDIEEMMDKPCDNLMDHLQEDPNVIHDIFEADFLKSFKGPHSGVLFVDRNNNGQKVEGRYVFALNVDFFNAEGMTQHGATTSTGIISMACLNLPITLRYKPEYMYIAGIIPGPTEPTGTQLNHYLRPLISDMVEFWDPGVYMSQTALYPTGRTTNCAIALCVNDLVAARQTSQLAGHSSHHYCTVCNGQYKDTLGYLLDKWKMRDDRETRDLAEKWRTLATVKDQEKHFKDHGVRWSELWRLPYWSPSRQLVVDSMHCILEGVVHHHFRHILGLTTASANAKADIIPAFTYEFQPVPKEQMEDVQGKQTTMAKDVSAIHSLLIAPIEAKDLENWQIMLSEKLAKRCRTALIFVCNDLNLQPIRDGTGTIAKRATKAQWAKALVNWVRIIFILNIIKRLILKSKRNEKPKVFSGFIPTKFATPQVIQRIKDVIKETVTPSWLNSVPYNYGDAAAGTLKADEWRTLSTVYFPIALVSLWGATSAHQSPDIAITLRSALDHTMSLISAVVLACTRVTSKAQAAAYYHYMSTYVGDLQQVHPDASHVPNHHMAMHIWFFLTLFGPVYSWWCFPFERLIYRLQQTPSNHKPGKLYQISISYFILIVLKGELEPVLLRTFIKASKLRRWLTRSDCPPALKECKTFFDKAYTHNASLTEEVEKDEIQEDSDVELLLADDQSHKSNTPTATPKPVPSDLFAIVKKQKAIMPARIKHNGVFFATSKTHLGNSLVLFYPNGDKSCQPLPGSIKYIFSHEGQMAFAIQRQLPLEPGAIDPFQPYDYFPAQLYSSKLTDTLEIARVDAVKCHYARWDFSDSHVVVVSLSRVSDSF